MEFFIITNSTAIVMTFIALSIIAFISAMRLKNKIFRVIFALLLIALTAFSFYINSIMREQAQAVKHELEILQRRDWKDEPEQPGNYSVEQIIVENSVAKTWKGLYLNTENPMPAEGYGEFTAFDCVVLATAPSAHSIGNQEAQVCILMNADEMIEAKVIPCKNIDIKTPARFVGYTCGKISVGSEDRKFVVGVLK